MSKKKKMKVFITFILAINIIVLGISAYAVDLKIMPDIYIGIPLCTLLFVLCIWDMVIKDKIKY